MDGGQCRVSTGRRQAKARGLLTPRSLRGVLATVVLGLPAALGVLRPASDEAVPAVQLLALAN
eukprot:3388507-Alexandrium_andersonii.AAC.1